MADYYRFPTDFLWGCATAAYQVEGAAKEDGKGPSIWDTCTHQPGRILMDHNGDVSVDQYHRYKEDVQIMKWLGVKAYRFSVSWPRVIPQGTGPVNEKGLAYYERLVDELLANGIQPWMTFYHWDLPQALQDRWGGWESPENAKAFGDYAAAVTKRLSDRVTNYFTVNEISCYTDQAYMVANPNGFGGFAPFKRVGIKARNQIRHTALLGHGLVVQAVRANAKKIPQVGIAENPHLAIPAIETPEHIAAARQAMRHLNAGFLTAIMEGAYLPAYLEEQGADAPKFTDAEMKIISSPLDFVGLNMYTPTYILADAKSPTGFFQPPFPSSYPTMNLEWLKLCPQIVYWTTRWASEIWKAKAVYVTENGCGSQDQPAVDGEIHDTDRVMYLRNHFIAAHRAISEGLPLKGYFVWSLLDNFEWAAGYTKRFGVMYVNYANLARSPKLSAKFYKEVIARSAVV